jgi:hypothetical protein
MVATVLRDPSVNWAHQDQKDRRVQLVIKVTRNVEILEFPVSDKSLFIKYLKFYIYIFKQLYQYL